MTVQGFDWCRDTARSIGVGAFARQMLCRRHNNELSEIDAEAVRVFSALNSFSQRLAREQAGSTHREGVATYSINGPLLELWFIKTLINLAYGGAASFDGVRKIVEKPERELAEIALNRRPLTSGAGLYVAASRGQMIESGDILEFSPLVHEGQLFGATFNVLGFRFLISITPSQPENLLALIPRMGEYWKGLELTFHLKRIIDRGRKGKRLNQVIRFWWDEPANPFAAPDDNRALRGRRR